MSSISTGGSGGGGGGGVTSITGNTGPAQTGAINLITANSIPIFAGAAGTITLDFALTNNLLLGSSGSITSGVDNVGYGKLAAASLSSGDSNCFIGYESGVGYTTGNQSTAVGAFAMLDAVAGASNNTVVGYAGLANLAGAGAGNLILGSNSGSAYMTTESDNILLDNSGVVGDSDTIRIGSTQSLAFMQGIAGNVVANTNMVTIDTVTGQLGSQAVPGGGGITTINGDSSSVTGATVTFTGQNVTGAYGQSTQFIGNGTTTMNFNLIDGGANFYAGSAATGSQLAGGANGSSNFLYGFQSSESLGSAGTSTANIIFGNNALRSQAVAQTNVILGSQAAEFVSVSTTFDNNIIIGTLAGQFGSGTSVTNNIAIGVQALQNIIDSGAGFTNNIGIGAGAGLGLSSGSESNNILIAGLGLSGESGVIQLGSISGPFTKCFIQGIASVAVSNTEMVIIDTTTGQLGSQAIPASPISTSAFLYLKSANQTVAGATTDLITFPTLAYDGGGFFAASTFTAPVSGVPYYFSVFVQAINASLGDSISLNVNGSPVATSENASVLAGTATASLTITLFLNAGDTVNVSYNNASVATNATLNGQASPYITWFSGYRLA